jgi:hypothetical protein
MQLLQGYPPETVQQVQPGLQQIMQLPSPQKEQQLQILLQFLQSQGGGQQQPAPQQQPPPQQAAPPQPMMQAQASAEDEMYAQIMQQQGSSQDPQQQLQADADTAQASATEATNELDNVKVTLTVRELLDLVGKGTATASLLKVKQLADTHKQKMDQSKQKADAAASQQQAQQQAQQQGMMGGGGIYPTPMGA